MVMICLLKFDWKTCISLVIYAHQSREGATLKFNLLNLFKFTSLINISFNIFQFMTTTKLFVFFVTVLFIFIYIYIIFKLKYLLVTYPCLQLVPFITLTNLQVQVSNNIHKLASQTQLQTLVSKLLKLIEFHNFR